VTDYNHFGEAQRGKCPLHENIEDRHEQEVKRAADEAMAKVRADNPGLSDADLMVKVSDRVKQAENVRRGRAGAEAQAFPYHMVGEQLRRVVPPPVFGAQAPVPPPQAPIFPPVVQYVHPHPLVVPLPVFGHPVQPISFFQPVQLYQPVDDCGAAPPSPQQPYQYVSHRPLVAPCPHCYLYHPPNQHC
jgi:TRIAD3 protein (E3 ubiquitin-protein ligase RNF216)